MAQEYDPEYLAESRVTLVTVFYSIPIVLMILSTTLRLWAKLRTEPKRLAFDDYLMIWATGISVSFCIIGLIYGPPQGLGRHIEAITSEDLKTFMMGDYIFSHLYDVALASTKLSVLALYYRVFPVQAFRIVVILTAVFVVLWMITMEVVLGFECRPIQAWWLAAEGQCLNLVAFAYFTNITNLVSDMWIFAMPLPIILKLQTNTNKRLTLCFLFSVGLGVCSISAARLRFVFANASTDITWDAVPMGILSAWEPCGGILCANLPMVYGMLNQSIRMSRIRHSTAHTDASQSIAGSSRGRASKGSFSQGWIHLKDSFSSHDELGLKRPERSYIWKISTGTSRSSTQ
ncbi:hypothetical protein PFICI_01648 [Pestalotiopsis fici W106-1]|uniref:Rhodopsin domain-containing protein n=1 Tax=Pestalotiopsis fici (strain W106-1 / CGMCC3.15140) TaxID=1229662 RepID=W3XPD6_PESFW|nr:uncharacterized protein PFICI_01648 [Pestalotiopsis fici W106-1]ETS87820.1 hypothetical protein PFICI_01648 [Pestalotiopsis fici W106-1]